MNLVIYCADVGSIPKKNFGWAKTDTSTNKKSQGSDIDSFCQRISSDLNDGRPVALGFECPLFVPVRDNPEALSEAREGEEDRPWSSNTGLYSLAPGLVETIYSLRKIKEQTKNTMRPYLDWNAFIEDHGDIFIWEAFVTGAAKSSAEDEKEHSEDAATAIKFFLERYPKVTEANAILEEEVHSLIGASLLRTGWTSDINMLKTSNVVIKPDSD